MKTISLRGLKEVLTERELKNVLGGSGESGGENCLFACQCTHNDNNPTYFIITACNNAPWDRNSDCNSGYQNCVLIGGTV